MFPPTNSLNYTTGIGLKCDVSNRSDLIVFADELRSYDRFLRTLRRTMRLAWRGLINDRARPTFIILTLALSIAAVSGVQSAARVARRVLQGDSRAWLAADLALESREPVNRDQHSALDRMKSAGVDWTLLFNAFTMASSNQAPDSGVISVKAVDPSQYPYYGAIGLAPPLSLKDALQPDTAIVSDEVLERLQVHTGDPIQIGKATFRIAAVIKTEPDRFTSAIGLGMRSILSVEGFERTGIRTGGNSVKSRVLLRVPDYGRYAWAEDQLREIFPDGTIRRSSTAYQRQTETTIAFLTVVSILVFALGALGLAIGIAQHVESALPSLAIAKMLGGRSVDTIGVLFVQVAMMVAAALALGIPLGLSVSASVLSGVTRYLAMPVSARWDPYAACATAVAALVGMAPVLVDPIQAIRSMRPGPVLRRAVERRAESFGAAGFVIAMGGAFVFLAIAMAVLQSRMAALVLTLAIAFCAGTASVMSFAGLGILRRAGSVVERWPVLRYGIAGLNRPGANAGVLIAAIATALTFLIATFIAGEVTARAAVELLPEQRDTLIIANVRHSQIEAAHAEFASITGVDKVETISQVTLPLRSWNDSTINGVTAGPSYLAMCDPGAVGLTMADDLAGSLGVYLGSTLEFEVRGQRIRTRLAAVKPQTPEERFWWQVKLDCSGLDPSGLSEQMVLRVRPENVGKVRRAIQKQFPTLPAVSAEEVVETLSAVSRDAMTLARTVAWYAVGAGVAVMIAIVAASRSARLSEIGILAALGARPVTVISIYTVEFAAIGVLAAAIASLLSWGFTAVVLNLVLHRWEAAIGWRALAAALGGTAALTISAGWIPSWRLLKKKPIEVLREIG